MGKDEMRANADNRPHGCVCVCAQVCVRTGVCVHMPSAQGLVRISGGGEEMKAAEDERREPQPGGSREQGRARAPHTPLAHTYTHTLHALEVQLWKGGW